MMGNEFVETSSNANGKRLLDIRNLIACHLYFTQGEVPTNAEFAARYEAAYEALPGRRRGE